MAESDAQVLIVDDEREVADIYALRLRETYDMDVAYGGEEALEKITAETDVVLLDRRMPGLSGDEVLQTIQERDFDVRVIMITAVDPDFDILDMPFDDYLQKPVSKSDLIDAIDQQLTAREYDSRLSKYFEVTSKLALLQKEKSSSEVESNEEIAALQTRAEKLREEMDETLAEFSDFEAAFREIERTSS